MDKYIIEVGCSSIRIHNYIMGDCIQLERQFMIWNIAYHKLEPFAMHYDEDTHILYLPRGVDLYYIQRLLHVNTNDLIWIKPYDYDTFSNIKMKYRPRDDRQRKALRFMLGINEYVANKDHSTLVVASSTGFGKSFCCIYTIAYTGIKSIIITYAISILNQWKDYIIKYTNMNDDDIYLIQGTGSIHKIFQDKIVNKNIKIYLVSHSTLRDYANNYGWNKIGELFKYINIGQCFIDEAHRDFDNICKISSYIDIYKMYYVTATPSRSSIEEDRIYQLAIKNFPKIDLYDADIDKHINYIAIKYTSNPTYEERRNMINMYGLDIHKYVDYITTKDTFYSMLRVIMDIAIKMNGPCLFYIDTNKAILRVYKWLCTEYPELSGNIGIFSGLVEQSLKGNEKKKRIILSTLKSAGAAEHIDGLKMVVVLAAPFKSNVIAIQASGRLRDYGTYFIELIDLSFMAIKKFYYAKLPIYHMHMLYVKDIYFSNDKLSEKAIDIQIRREKSIIRNPIRAIDRRFGIIDNITPIIENTDTNKKINPIITHTIIPD